MRMYRVSLTIIALAVMLVLPACAAKGIRNQTRVGALTVGEAALALNTAEQQVAAANVPGYGPDQQKQVGAAILKVLTGARAYERAAASWKSDVPAPDALAAAKQGISLALDDLIKITPAIDVVRLPIFRAIEGLRAALAASTVSEVRGLESVRAQVVPAGVTQLFALANLFLGLIGSGRSTFTKLKAAMQKEGATDEELAALDAQLSDAIAAREGDASQG